MNKVAQAGSVFIFVTLLGCVGGCRTKPPNEPIRPEPAKPPGASAPGINGTYANEQTWIVSEVSQDLAEMVSYAHEPKAGARSRVTVEPAPGSVPSGVPSYGITVTTGSGKNLVKAVVTLADHAWSPRDYAELAEALVGDLRRKPHVLAQDQGSMLAALTELRPATLEKENQRISAWLARDMLNPMAHEEAGLLLGAFALREAAGPWSDSRRALNGMAAHLALARALRGASAPGVQDDYAQLLLTTLIGRQRDAMEQLAHLRAKAKSGAEKSWLNALAMRNTGDWRVVADPTQATFLEVVEYVRALKRSQSGLKALEFLGRRRLPMSAEWPRIVLEGRFSVEEGNVLAGPAVELELQEYESVVKLGGRSELRPQDLTVLLNRAPGRCISQSPGSPPSPHVIDEGSWPSFAQRHLLQAVVNRNDHLQKSLGLEEDAAAFRADVSRRFEGLTLFPFIREQWRPSGGPPSTPGGAPKLDPEHGRCVAPLGLVRGQPQLVTASLWQGLLQLCWRARMEGTLIEPTRWFTPGLPTGTLYDVDLRTYTTVLKPNPPEIARLFQIAPYDKTLMYWTVSARPPNTKMTAAEFASIYGPVVDYDASAQYMRTTKVQEEDESFKVSAKRACDADADECMAMGQELVKRGAFPEAVEAYESAVDKARDRVSVAYGLRWLIQYHFEEGRTERALEVARLGAAVGSGAGLANLGQLFERMGRYSDAESIYKALVQRYPGNADILDSFYFRHERRHHDGMFKAQTAAAEKELFPEGLKRVSVAELPKRPHLGDPGFLPMGGSEDELAPAGVKLGDTVMAVDGYRVKNPAQYLAVMSLTDDPDITLIVWRMDRYLDLKGRVAGRRLYGPRSVAATSPPQPPKN